MENKNDQLDEILKNRTLYYFYQLSQIPRGSGDEKAVSDYIYGWAVNLGLEVRQDDVFNLIIKKRAAAGYEAAEPILLQAHMDMVCDKEPDSTHDFLKDAISWKVDGDFITSAAGTSLGADCGIGVALIMSVLEDAHMDHPPIEVLLTVREETDMEGAYRAGRCDFKAKKLINLDISPDDRLLAGSCGGAAVSMKLSLRHDDMPSGHVCAEITISGLLGGHSGADIHKGRGNAILLLMRFLRMVYGQMEGQRLVSFEGGNSRLAIPREAKLRLSLPPEKMEYLELLCREFYDEVKEEYIESAPKLLVNMKKVLEKPEKVISEEDVKKIITTGLFWPDGIQEMSNLIEGTVESSSNLGILEMDTSSMRFTAEVRSTYPSSRQNTILKLQTLAELVGAECGVHSIYPEWRYKKSSLLRSKILEIYRRREHKEMTVFSAHAGNEIGILYSQLDLEDAVAIGPSRYFFHTPKEKLSISSSVRFEEFLKEILAELS